MVNYFTKEDDKILRKILDEKKDSEGQLLRDVLILNDPKTNFRKNR